MLAVIVVAVIVLSALALLWVLLDGGLTIPPDETGDGIKEGQVATKTDEESPLEEKPSELPPDGTSGTEKVIEQPASTEPDATTPPVEQPMPPEPDAAKAPAEKPAASETDAAAPPDEKPAPRESSTPKTPVEEPIPSSTPKAAKTMPPATGSAVAKDDTADEKDFLSLLSPFETVGVKTNGDPVRRSVALSGEEHQFGIWAQPAEDRGTAQLSYLLKGRFAGLRGKAGVCDAPDDAAISDNAGPSGVLRIYGDGNLLWESDLLTGAGAVEQFEIEVKGIELLALTVESDSPAELSRFAWGNLELTKGEE